MIQWSQYAREYIRLKKYICSESDKVCSGKKNKLERCDVGMWAEFSKGIIRERLVNKVPS